MNPLRRALVAAGLGLLLVVPLIAVMVGAAGIGLPFLPFDLFDAAARVLPGAVLTAGIDSMVSALGALGLSVRESAKTAEQIMALVGFGVLAALTAAVLGTLVRRRRIGWFAAGGLVLALVLTVFSRLVLTGGGWAAALLWNGLLLAGWGATTGFAMSRVGTAPHPAAAETLDRRRFLVRLGGAAAVITVAGAGLARLLAPRTRDADALAKAPRAPLPERGDALTPAPGTRPEYTPLPDHYRIDIDTRPPRIDGETWRLEVGGLVERGRTFTLGDLRAMEAQHLFVTLSCISNPIAGELIGTTRWTGVPLRRFLDRLGPKPEARWMRIQAVDGFHESLPLDEAREDDRVMLCYAWDDVPLTTEHGFPLRVYRPNRYGMKQPKWITRVELTEEEVPGYWVDRGWDREALMKATSVIDTVAVEEVFTRDGRAFVPIGGIAHAGSRGISKVDVRVDEGPWMEAQTRTPLSDLTWVIWRYDWPFQAGEHRFTVRCWDGEGRAQIVERTAPHPSGATGLHSVEEELRSDS